MPVFNLDDLIQPAAEVVFGGERLLLRALTIEQRAVVQKRLRDIVPNPLVVATESLAAMPRPSREVVDSVWKTAEATYRFWPPLVESEEGQHWLWTHRGIQALILGMSTGLGESHETIDKMLTSINFSTLAKMIGFALTGEETGGNDPKGRPSA